MAEPILDIRDLKTWFKTDDGLVRPISFDARYGEAHRAGLISKKTSACSFLSVFS